MNCGSGMESSLKLKIYRVYKNLIPLGAVTIHPSLQTKKILTSLTMELKVIEA